MVEIIYEPWKTIVIHEIVQHDFQMFINLHSLGVQSGQLGRPLHWANGVAFDHSAMQPADEVVREQIHGKIHWSSVAFTFMPKYQQLIVVSEENIRIPVIDLSGNEIFSEIAEWIKKNYKPNNSARALSK